LSLIDLSPVDCAAELARIPELALAPTVEPTIANPAATPADFKRVRRLKDEAEFSGDLDDVLMRTLSKRHGGYDFKKASAIEMRLDQKVLHRNF
jgi:hypothetical protein